MCGPPAIQPLAPLVLASASPRRRALLEALGLVFEVHPCPLREPAAPPPGVAAGAWAESLAYFKALAVARAFPRELVLGADTLVVCAGETLGKPRDLPDARRMLAAQAGRPSLVITGVALVLASRGARRLGRAVTRVWMRDAPAEREEYLRSGDWVGKAGAYGVQDVGDRLVERIEGDFDNVVGLPGALVAQLLRVARNWA